MKIGIDTFGCDHAKSGLGAYLFSLVSNLPKRDGLEFELFGSEVDRYTYRKENELNFVSPKVRGNLTSERLWHYNCVNGFAKKNKFDAVIYPAPEKVLPVSFGVLGIVVVNTVLSPLLKKGDTFLKYQLKKGLKKVQIIVVASEFIKQDLEALGVESKKITVIYNGIDHKHFFPSLDTESDFVDIKPFAIKKPYFIYGSRLSGPEKKHVELIRAFSIFKEKTSLPHRLVLAGEAGEWSDNVHDAAFNSPFSQDIFVTGYFPHEAFPELYRGSEACIFPSVAEGAALPVLEAMACGIPVACSNSAALPEIGGDVPLYFNSDNPEEIAETMEKIVLDLELRKSMISKGLDRASEFSWEKTATKTINLIMAKNT